MNSSFFGTLLNVDSGVLKFFASTSFGVCVSQSVIRKVWNSSKFPSSKTRRNLHPSGPRALNRMRDARWEEPQVTFAHIVYKAPATFVHCGDARAAVQHNGPFRFYMPMQLAYTTGRQPHLYTCDRRRNRQVPYGHLPRPSPAFNALA